MPYDTNVNVQFKFTINIKRHETFMSILEDDPWYLKDMTETTESIRKQNLYLLYYIDKYYKSEPKIRSEKEALEKIEELENENEQIRNAIRQYQVEIESQKAEIQKTIERIHASHKLRLNYKVEDSLAIFASELQGNS